MSWKENLITSKAKEQTPYVSSRNSSIKHSLHAEPPNQRNKKTKRNDNTGVNSNKEKNINDRKDINMELGWG